MRKLAVNTNLFIKIKKPNFVRFYNQINCKLHSDFTHKSKKSKFIWLNIMNLKHFCSSALQ